MEVLRGIGVIIIVLFGLYVAMEVLAAVFGAVGSLLDAIAPIVGVGFVIWLIYILFFVKRD